MELSEAARSLKDPNNIKSFICELSENFTTEDAVLLGAKYDFSSRNINRLLKSLNGLNINKVSHEIYTKIHNE